MSDQSEQQSLAELCSVCYNSQPKYRCPRCKTQTCSLPCYKRHQQRASCNGQRDPAVFVKKSAWATPSGIDHDYNYLKSVERKVDVAWQDVQERGIGNRKAQAFPKSDEESSNRRLGEKQVAKAWLSGSALQRYLGEHRIHVERAPAGMSRQKANRTRTTNKGKVFWSVEWVDDRGVKTVDDESASEVTIAELWTTVEARKLNAEQGRKRKRNDGSAPLATSRSGKPEPAQVKVVTDALASRDLQLATVAGPEDEPAHDDELNETAQVSPPDPAAASADTATKSVATERDAEKWTTPQRHFYLLRPFTASKSQVLIPLSPQETLTRVLNGRTILEFPTIFALLEPPDALPEGYMTEEAYEMDKAMNAPASLEMLQPQGIDATGPSVEDQPLDANSILDMLQRDIGTR